MQVDAGRSEKLYTAQHRLQLLSLGNIQAALRGGLFLPASTLLQIDRQRILICILALTCLTAAVPVTVEPTNLLLRVEAFTLRPGGLARLLYTFVVIAQTMVSGAQSPTEEILIPIEVGRLKNSAAAGGESIRA